MKRLAVVLVVIFVLSALLTACGGGGAGAATNSAKEFFTAFSALDFAKMKGLTCEAQKSNLDQMLSAISAGGQSVDQLKQILKIDVSGLTFTEKGVSGNSGTVVVSGKMKMEFMGQSQEQDANNEELPMVNEGGQWKVCTTKLPGG